MKNRNYSLPFMLRGILSFALFAGVFNILSATCTITGGVIGSDQNGCKPFDPAVINNVTSVTSPFGGPFEYLWLSTTDAGAVAGNNQNWTIISNNSASYNPGALQVTTWFRRCARRGANGCVNYDGESNWVKITVNNVPTAAISGNTSIQSGQTTTLTASGGSSYAWSTGANTAAISVSPVANTTYTVTVTANGCSSTATATVNVTAPPPPPGNDCNNIGVVPGAGQIVINGLTAPVVMVQVFNASWAQVFAQNYTNQPGSITVPGLPAGQYYVKVNFLTAGWSPICNKEAYYTVTGGAPTGVLTLNTKPDVAVTAASGATTAVVNFTAPTASTTCPGGITTVTQTGGLASGSAFPIGTTTITYQATDNCGNVKTTSFLVVVTAGATTTLPTLTVKNVTVGENVGQAQVEVCLSAISATPVTFTFTTANGSATAGSDYTAISSSITIPANTLCLHVAVGILEDTNIESAETINVSISNPSGATIAVGSAVVTINDNDTAGGGTPDCNTITVTPGAGNIVLGGLNAPVIMVQIFDAAWGQVFAQNYTNSPGTVTVPGLANGQYYVKISFLTANWASICNKEAYYTVGGTPPPPPGTCTLTLDFLAANKICNNNGTPNNAADDTWTVDFTAKVTANPNNLPTWMWTASIGGTAATGMYDMVKNLGPFPISGGSLTFTYTDTDNPSCSKIVTITPPASCSNGTPTGVLALACGSDVAAVAAAGSSTAVVNFPAPTTSTTCTAGSNVTLTQTAGLASGSAFPVGNTTITYQATDACGNVKTCSFLVTVTAAPTGIDCNNITITPGNGNIVVGGLTAPIIIVQAFNAGWAQVFNQTYTNNPGTVTIPGLANGTYFVKVDFLNASWNAVCKREGYFTVSGTAPTVLTLNCGNNVTVTAAAGQASAVVNYTIPTATSTCTTGAVTVTRTAGGASGSVFTGNTTVTYQATDGCGNVKTCTFNIIVLPGSDPCANETTAPTINNCPANQSLTAAAKYTVTNTNKCGTAGTYGFYMDFVDSNLNEFDLTNATFQENANGTASLNGTATCQANANIKFTVSVNYTGRVTAPPAGSPKALDCTSAVSAYGNDVRFYTGFTGTLTGIGGSAGVSFAISRRGPSFQVGTGANLRQSVLGASGWLTFVKSGNSANVPAVSEGDFNFNLTPAATSAVANWTAPTATDNCSTPTLTSNFNSGAAFPVGNTIVSYTATDAKGNKSTCNFNITVTQVNVGGGNPGSGSLVDPNKCYYIVNKASGKVIDAEDRDNAANATYINQFAIDNTSSEKWKFQDAGNGYFYIVSQYSGWPNAVIDIAGGSTANGAYADVVTPNGQDCTKFCFQDAGNGYVYLVAKHSGLAIKTVASPGVDGTQIFQQPINAANEHQKWLLQEVGCAGAAVAANHQLTFNAYRKGLNVELKWINNTGDKNEFFDIERSADGEHFTKIGRVDGKGGNVGDQLYFQNIDHAPLVGDNIYRLKMVWKDGTVQYSNEQTVNFGSQPALGIYPNPASDILFVDLSAFVGEQVDLQFFNQLGVLVHRQSVKTATEDAVKVELNAFFSGSYFLRIQSENNRPEVRQIMVEKF